MKYIKHFSQKANNYLRFRPVYPDDLFKYLNNLVPVPHLAWDCGAGNGQAAIALTKYFDQVIATDVNFEPLEAAPKLEKINYICCLAEKTPIKSNSVDLITIAQALHWFDFELFYKEVKRVAKETALIAAWCYSLGGFNSAVDLVISKFYKDILGDEYWPERRSYIDQEYQTIPFPFPKITSPSFFIQKEMNFSELLGYLNTWSALKEYELRNKTNPINLVAQELLTSWGNPFEKQKMVWPIHLLVGTLE
ncbi:MAG: class I SAM-dependent methyltransferase [Tatlockia sp.]|nr:class I SAM-dependent methyltransferase [Tatlockia sp.]